MRRWLTLWVLGGVAGCGLAYADDRSDDVEALRRRVEAQERRIRELEGSSLTADEVASTIDRYLSASPVQATLVGGEEAKGSAGFPKGKHPFIKEGANKLEVWIRTQVRYSSFLYSDDAVGTLKSPPSTIDDSAPRDRSGFELERFLLTFEGTIFCEDITYMGQVNFDSDAGTGLDKRYMYIDWKYSGEHHVRAGGDKVAHTYEEQNSSGSLAFVDRGLLRNAFGLDFDTGVGLWGYFGSCECPKQFLYKVQAMNGEGRIDRGSPFNVDAFDTHSDQLLFAGLFEWVITCDEFKMDEVDHRPCDKRCKLAAALGASGYYENDDDNGHTQHGMRLGSTGPLDRMGFAAWFRAHYDGWSLLLEACYRDVDYTAGSAAEDQTDWGAQAILHYRFADSNWGVGVRGTAIFLDDDYLTRTVGVDTVDLEDTIWEVGAVVNYFFWDHAHKISADVTWVADNSAVSSSGSGYLVNPATGVVIEDGLMFRVQWQLSL
jgi:hypothetical protein